MHKRLCACGCGDRVTRKVELQHMNALNPAVAASRVLDQNPRLNRRKKRSQTIGFPAPLRRKLAMGPGNTTDHAEPSGSTNASADPVDVLADSLDEDIYMDYAGPSGTTNADVVLPDSSNEDVYVDHAGPSGRSADAVLPDFPNEDFHMDHPEPSTLSDDDAGMGGYLDREVYGLSNLRRSQRIADHVEKIGQERWGSNAPVHFVNNREVSDEEEEDIEDDESIGDFDAASDEGLDEEDDDELFAGSGQEGISLWDSLGEGFLKEASQLGMSFWYYYFLNSNSYSRGKASGRR
jgi:hypothetical protein